MRLSAVVVQASSASSSGLSSKHYGTSLQSVSVAVNSAALEVL